LSGDWEKNNFKLRWKLSDECIGSQTVTGNQVSHRECLKTEHWTPAGVRYEQLIAAGRPSSTASVAALNHIIISNIEIHCELGIGDGSKQRESTNLSGANARVVFRVFLVVECSPLRPDVNHPATEQHRTMPHRSMPSGNQCRPRVPNLRNKKPAVEQEFRRAVQVLWRSIQRVAQKQSICHCHWRSWRYTPSLTLRNANR